MDRLVEENRRLRMDLDDCDNQQQPVMMPAPMCNPCCNNPCQPNQSSLLELLPASLDISSMKRADFRRIFERLVSELSRRKSGCSCGGGCGGHGHGHGSMVMPHGAVQTVSYEPYPQGHGWMPRRHRGGHRDDDIRGEVDRIWDPLLRDVRRPTYGLAPSYSGYPPTSYPTRSADDFLRFSGSNATPLPAAGSSAEDFLRFSAPAPAPAAPVKSNDADDFLRFGGDRANSSRSNDADAFLRSSGGGGRSAPLANNADAFLQFGR